MANEATPVNTNATLPVGEDDAINVPVVNGANGQIESRFAAWWALRFIGPTTAWSINFASTTGTSYVFVNDSTGNGSIQARATSASSISLVPGEIAVVITLLDPATNTVEFRKISTNTSGSGGSSVWFETLAAMAAAPGPKVKTFAWQVETDAPYEFVPGDATAIDGWTCVGPTGGTAGRWLLRSAVISIAPLGNGLNDWPRLNQLSAAVSASPVSNAKIYMRTTSDPWLCKSPGAFSSNTTIEFAPGGVIVSSMLAIGNQTNCVFKLLGVAPAGPATTLAAPSVPGNIPGTRTSVLNVAAPVPTVGQVIIYGDGTLNNLQQATVIAVAGPLVTIDEVIEFAFAAGGNTTVAPSIVTTNVHVIGNGLEITGTGDRAVEFVKGRQCSVRGINVTPRLGTFSDISVAMDIGGRDMTFEDVMVDCGDVTTVGLALEAGTRYTARRCRTIRTGAGGQGFWVYYGSSDVEDCEAMFHATHGLLLDVNVGATVRGGRYSQNSGSGIIMTDSVGIGSINQLQGIDTSDNAGDGVRHIAGQSANIVNMIAQRNVNSGLRIDTGSINVGNLLTGQQFLAGVIVSGGVVKIRGWKSYQEAEYALDQNGPSKVSIDEFEWVASAGSFIGAFVEAGAGASPLNLENGVIDMALPTGGIVVNHVGAAGSVVSMERVIASGTGGAGGKGYVGAAGVTLREGSRVVLDTLLTPYTINASGFANKRGSTSALNAGANAIAWPNLNGSDRVKLLPVTYGGAPAGSPVVSYTPGTGFSLFAAAGNVGDVYAWEIG